MGPWLQLLRQCSGYQGIDSIVMKYFSVITFQTFLVAGGYNHPDVLSSTELLVETASAWVFFGELPSPRSNLRGATIDNKGSRLGKKIISFRFLTYDLPIRR